MGEDQLQRLFKNGPSESLLFQLEMEKKNPYFVVESYSTQKEWGCLVVMCLEQTWANVRNTGPLRECLRVKECILNVLDSNKPSLPSPEVPEMSSCSHKWTKKCSHILCLRTFSFLRVPNFLLSYDTPRLHPHSSNLVSAFLLHRLKGNLFQIFPLIF